MTTATKSINEMTTGELMQRDIDLGNSLAAMGRGWWGTIDDIRDMARDHAKIRRELHRRIEEQAKADYRKNYRI